MEREEELDTAEGAVRLPRWRNREGPSAEEDVMEEASSSSELVPSLSGARIAEEGRHGGQGEGRGGVAIDVSAAVPRECWS
jgi:hypothetical protein